MNRTIVLLRLYAGAGSMLLVLSLVLLAGCSEEGDDGQTPDGKYGLGSKELVALKKANKGPGNFKKALRKLEIDELRARGVVVKTTPSGTKANGRR